MGLEEQLLEMGGQRAHRELDLLVQVLEILGRAAEPILLEGRLQIAQLMLEMRLHFS
jgi:hypothetical protein